jgi:YVTN family beta-propeller protein
MLACAPVIPGGPQTQAGSIAISAKGQLFVAANDNGGVAIVNPAAKSGAVAFIATGDRPEHLISRGGQVFVANRQSRMVTQIDSNHLQVVRQIAVGAEPMGLDTTTDGLLLVACAMSGTLQAIDPADGSTRWTVPLNEEVRAVAAASNGLAYVPSYRSGVVHVVDTKAGVESAPIDMSVTHFPTYQVRGVEAILLNPLTGLAYLPHTESRASAVAPFVSGTSSTSGGYSQPTPIPDVVASQETSAPITVAAVTTVNIGTKSATSNLATGQMAGPPTASGPPLPGTQSPATQDPSIPVTSNYAGPRLAALDPQGRNLYFVSYLGWAVTAQPVDSSSQLPPLTVTVGHGPTGIAIAGDDESAYVYNSFDHSISVLGGKYGTFQVLRTIENIAPQTLTPSQQHGRLLFHSAGDPRMSAQGTGGVACASCHPDGREDGHTWLFPEGPRNTPSLVGRHLELTGPYHWDGQLDKAAAFNFVVHVRMGGAGITPSDLDDIFAWLEREPGPDNPNRLPDGLTDDQQTGRSIFVSAGCVACHAGPAMTDNGFHDVGTQFTTVPFAILQSGIIQQTDVTGAIPNTPSLLGVFASAPYLHDGSKATLQDRIIDNPNDAHGVTSNLTKAQVDQLVAFLKTL